MDFWSRMLSGIADTILPKALEEDALLLQMEEALQEEKELWRARQNFLEPIVARSFQNKRRSARSAARCAGSGTPCTPQWRSRRWRAGRYPPPACPGTRCTSSRRWRRDSRTSDAAAPRHRACPGRPPACRRPGPGTTAATRRRSGSTGSGGCPINGAYCHARPSRLSRRTASRPRK